MLTARYTWSTIFHPQPLDGVGNPRLTGLWWRMLFWCTLPFLQTPSLLKDVVFSSNFNPISIITTLQCMSISWMEKWTLVLWCSIYVYNYLDTGISIPTLVNDCKFFRSISWWWLLFYDIHFILTRLQLWSFPLTVIWTLRCRIIH